MSANLAEKPVFYPRNDTEMRLWFLVERHGWLGSEVQALANPRVRAEVQQLIRGRGDARLAMRVDEHLILPESKMSVWQRPDHNVFATGNYYLLVADEQHEPKGISGEDLQHCFEDRQAVDASILYDYTQHPDKIPLMFLAYDRIFFWGTQFRNRDGTITCIGCLQKVDKPDPGEPCWRREAVPIGAIFRARDAALMFQQDV